MLVLVGIGCSARIGVDLSSRERRGGPEDATAEDAEWAIEGDPGSGEAVVAVGIGDVDGDGVDDVAIGGAPDEYRYGRVLVYAGAAGGPSEEPTTWISGATIGDGFGRSIARLGDVNLDGYDDIAVGANGDGLWDGAVYIYLGSATGLETEPSEMIEDTSAWAFGWAVASAGDVNADGYPDLLIGAPFYSSSKKDGRAFLYYGSAAGFSSTVPAKVTGGSKAYLGYAVAGAGDVDGDGYDDVVLGGYTSTSEIGTVYVHLGSATGLTVTPATTLTGAAVGDLFGATLAGLGDVDGDGYDDVAVGASAAGGGAGEVYVYLGSSAGTSSTAAATWTGGAGEGVGSALVGVNLDGDDYLDLVVGEMGASVVTTYAGGASGVSSSGTSLDNGGDGGSFGGNVGAAGDVNADGIDDLLVVAPGYGSGTDKGRVYLHFGSSGGVTRTASASWTGDKEQPERLGYALSSRGDVNGDGFDDVVIGAPATGIGDASPGRMYLYTGSSTGLDVEPAGTWEGSAGTVWYARRVAILGDVDADGFDDVAVGAAGEPDGAVHLLYGAAAGLSATPDVLDVGTDGTYLGYVLCAAGDVNGDGHADLLAADPSYDAGAFSAVFLWLGSSTGMPAASAASWLDTGSYTPVLAGDGDIDGDGFDDVLIAKVGSSIEVYSGSSTGSSASATQTLTPPAADTKFAASLVLAGDLDSDGYDELVAGTTEEDVIYVYAGSAAGLTYTRSVASPDGDPFGDQLARLDDRDVTASASCLSPVTGTPPRVSSTCTPPPRPASWTCPWRATPVTTWATSSAARSPAAETSTVTGSRT